MILRARIVLPVARPPIENGAVVIDSGKICRVGKWEELGSHEDAIDLGEVILLPGLVNAHCHLDYSGMGGKILSPSSFTDWIKLLIGLKNATSTQEFQHAWLEGAHMLAQTGTTTVADVEAFPEILKDVLPSMPLRVFSFLEVLNPRLSQLSPEEILQNALKQVPFPGGSTAREQDASWPKPFQAGGVNPGWWFGLSPHAPYSTTPELLQTCQKMAAANGWRVTAHISESEPEFEMYMYARGLMYDWLKNQRSMEDCGHGSPLGGFTRAGLINQAMLAVHMNYLWHDDAAVLGRQDASVVHCPRSHRYFRHGCFPRRTLETAGVNVCLGTDSMASMEAIKGVLELNMFSEMQMLASWDNTISPANILRMSTLHGATALGLKGLIGEISPQAYADLIVIPYKGKVDSVYEAIIHHQGPVAASMVGGRWVVPPAALGLTDHLPLIAERGTKNRS